MRKFKRKTPSHVANTYIRNLLAYISEELGGISEKDLIRTRSYFDGKCPYSGRQLTQKNSSYDHIIPQNREECGLDLYGNIILCHKEANASKGKKGFEAFIDSLQITDNEKEDRKKQIVEFIEQSGYQKRVKLINDIKNLVKIKYQEIHNLTQQSFATVRSSVLIDNFQLEKEKIQNEFEENFEIIKVKRKVPKWLNDPNQKNSKILLRFLQIKSNTLCLDYFKNSCSDIINLKSSLKNMSSFNKNNDGKVFEIINNEISLWSPVKSFIIEEYQQINCTNLQSL